jgi:hypothetical protein
MPRPVDVINVSQGNVVWGPLVRRVIAEPDPLVAVERVDGWPPVTIVAFVVFGLLYTVRLFASKTSNKAETRQILALSLLLTCAMVWLTEIKFSEGTTAWTLVHHLVPGAKAIRAPGRMSLVINFGVVIMMALGLDTIRRMTSHRRALRALAVALACAILAEQINTQSTHQMSRKEEADRFGFIGAPPKACTAFFAVRSKAYNPLELQTDAMMLAGAFRIPTINGYSGWAPRDWALFTGNSTELVAQASRWAFKNNIEEGLCSLDLTTGVWSVGAAKYPEYRPGDIIDFASTGSQRYTLSGWAGPEPGWGEWTVGQISELVFKFNHLDGKPLTLEARMHVFAPPMRPTFQTSVVANGSSVATWNFAAGEEDPVSRRAVIPSSALRDGALRLRLDNSDPRSPKETGISGDPRKLSFALKTLRITTAGD